MSPARATAAAARTAAVRDLVVVLGDQLDRRSAAFDGFDATRDLVWMAEAHEESTHVWSAKQRIAIFLAAMRHFAAALRDEGLPVEYHALGADGSGPPSLARALADAIERHRPAHVVLVEPGDHRVEQALREAVRAAGTVLDLRPDRHFFCSAERFARHAKGKKSLRMEFFYREMRREHGVLMQRDAAGAWQPAGGAWNFDAENRSAFGPDGPGFLPGRARFEPDAITREVIELVNARFAAHPGRLDSFAWPVTRAQALEALARFVDERLEHFGRWQDAMWEGEPWLYHAHLSAALNLKLLDPREVVARAEAAWREGRVGIESAEGFIRQVLGWREYVRGIYRLWMPGYLERNALDARAELPGWYWTGEVPMKCLADAIGQTLEHGYAHHIQRLMVTGLYALLLGVQPKQVHAWYLAVYVDAVEWVELPNVLGMSQYADGGALASKPYVATGAYIDRMSDHCRGCRFDPKQRSGERACPFTTLYWDFLLRHEARFASHPRMALQVKNLGRVGAAERGAIRARAAVLKGGGW